MDLELLLIGGFAVFIGYKLWSVLGSHSEEDVAKAAELRAILEEQKLEQAQENEAKQKPTLELEPEDSEEIPTAFAKDIEQIRDYDREFSLKEFAEGATGAFEMIIEGLAKGKKDALKFLLSKDIYKNFDSVIKERKKQELEASANVISIEEPEIIDIELQGSVCQIVVRFVSEQINFIKNKAGEIIEGSKSQIERVNDVWTFERDLNSSQPNWVVVGTQSV